MPLHPAHPISSLCRPPPHPVSYQPTPTSTTTYMFSLPPQFLPPSAPPGQRAKPPLYFPPCGCSQPAHLLEGRNHSFFLGFVSSAVKCGSKFQRLLSAGDCTVEWSSVWVLEPDGLGSNLGWVALEKLASVSLSFCIRDIEY